MDATANTGREQTDVMLYSNTMQYTEETRAYSRTVLMEVGGSNVDEEAEAVRRSNREVRGVEWTWMTAHTGAGTGAL